MNDFDPAGGHLNTHDDYKDNETCAKRVMPALFAWFLLISASSTYFTLVFPEFLDSIGQSQIYFFSLAAAHGAIFLFVIINFVISTFMDPGRFPKVDVNEVIDEFKQNSGTYKNVLINDVNVRMKWCTTCQFFRPPRSSHCGVCNACIDTMDHHCPWICNCIARRNYKYFLQFLISLTVHMLIILGFSIALVFINKENLTQLPIIVAVFMIIIVGILIIPIGGLTGFHVILVSRGRTTNEQVTGKFRTGVNPFDLGFCTNWARTLCTSASPSYVHFVSEKRKRYEYMETMLALEAAKAPPVKTKLKHPKHTEIKRPIDYDNYDDLDVPDPAVLHHHNDRRQRIKQASSSSATEPNKIKYNGTNLLASSSAVMTASVRDEEEDNEADESVHMLRSESGNKKKSSSKSSSGKSKTKESRHEQYEMHGTHRNHAHNAAANNHHDQYYEEREQQTLENGQSVWVNRDTLRSKTKQRSSSSNSKKYQFDESTSAAMAYADAPNFAELPPKYHHDNNIPSQSSSSSHSNSNGGGRHGGKTTTTTQSNKKYSALNGGGAGSNGGANRDKQLTNKLLMQENLNNNNQFIRNNSYVKANYTTANVDSYYDKQQQQQLSIPVHYQTTASEESAENEKRSAKKAAAKSRVSHGQQMPNGSSSSSSKPSSRSHRSSSGHRQAHAASSRTTDDDSNQLRLNSMSDDQSGTAPDYASYEITV